MQLIMSVVGMAVLILIAVLLSSNRRAINLRTVIGAFLIQVVIGAFVLYVPTGRDVLGAMSSGVANVIAYGNEGISFILAGWCLTRCLKSSAVAGLYSHCVFCPLLFSSLH